MNESAPRENHSKIDDYFAITLWVSSDQMDPDSVTQRVGLEPTRVRLRGTPIRAGMMRRPEFDKHEWSVEREIRLANGLLVPEESEAAINHFLKSLIGSAAAFRALSEEHDVAVVLVYHMKYVPYIGLTRRQVQFIAELGARIDFDVMVDTLPA